MKIILNKNRLYTYIFVFIGLLFICIYLWFRFFRERLPKNIPFNLTFISLFFLIFIILSLFLVLYKIKYPGFNSKTLLFIINKCAFLLKPVYILDNFIKQNGYIQKYKLIYLSHFIKKYQLYFCKPNYIFFILTNILLKFLVLFSFLIDIFYFSKLQLFYYFISLNFIVLLLQYIIYSIKNTIEYYLQYLENNFYLLVDYDKNSEKMFMCSVSDLKSHKDFQFSFTPADSFLDIRFFVEMQASNYIFEYDLYEYQCVETDLARSIYAEKHNIKLPLIRICEPDYDDISKVLSKEFYDIMPKIIYLQAFKEIYEDITIKKYSKWQIVIIGGYLISWTYILYVSIHTLNIIEIIELLQDLQDTTEPFSDLNVEAITKKQ